MKPILAGVAFAAVAASLFAVGQTEQIDLAEYPLEGTITFAHSVSGWHKAYFDPIFAAFEEQCPGIGIRSEEMTDGGPSRSTQLLSHLLYEEAFGFSNTGFASAVAVVPNFLLLARLGLIDSLGGLIVPFWGSAFAVSLFRQAILRILSDFHDAAAIDGCTVGRRALRHDPVAERIFHHA